MTGFRSPVASYGNCKRRLNSTSDAARLAGTIDCSNYSTSVILIVGQSGQRMAGRVFCRQALSRHIGNCYQLILERLRSVRLPRRRLTFGCWLRRGGGRVAPKNAQLPKLLHGIEGPVVLWYVWKRLGPHRRRWRRRSLRSCRPTSRHSKR